MTNGDEDENETSAAMKFLHMFILDEPGVLLSKILLIPGQYNCRLHATVS